MTNTYSDMTGVLILDKVTPVIEALFTTLELDETIPGDDGQAYIADIAESTDSSWDSMLDNLRELLDQLKLTLPEDAEDNVEEHLNLLAEHFGADKNVELLSLIEQTDFDSFIDLESLFTIARAFDDGHGLKGIKTETSWHCSKPLLFEFGGAGRYLGLHVSLTGSSSQVRQLGEGLETALASQNTEKAAEILKCNVQNLLDCIIDDAARLSIRSRLSELLALTVEPS